MPTKGKKISKKLEGTKWKKIFTPRIVVAATVCALCAFMAIICLLCPGTKEVSVVSPVENLSPLEAITPKDRIVQKFTADNNYARFGLYYANFANYIQGGELYIDVENQQNETSKFSYNIGGLSDNSFLYVDYPLRENETYTISIHVSDEVEGVTFFTTTNTNNNTALTINKHVEDESIIMVFNRNVEDRFMAWYYVLAIVVAACYIILNLDKGVYDKKR